MRAQSKEVRIAIDGPAASGKSTVARILSKELNSLYIDTGAMYRALTWKALKMDISLSDEEALTRLAKESRQEFLASANPPGYRLLLDGVDVTCNLHTPAVDERVSLVAKVPGVRREMVRRQREMAAKKGIVMAGRDITTVVLPDAEVKVFLTASLEERARRRYIELCEKNVTQGQDEVLESLRSRDSIDSTREDSPLRIGDGTFVIDSTHISPEEVAHQILALVRAVSGGNAG